MIDKTWILAAGKFGMPELAKLLGKELEKSKVHGISQQLDKLMNHSVKAEMHLHCWVRPTAEVHFYVPKIGVSRTNRAWIGFIG